MFIIKKSVLKTTLLILFIIVLFLQLTRVYKIGESFGENEQIELKLQMLGASNNCWFNQQNYNFQLKNCSQYQTGSVLLITGRVRGESDSHFWESKRLEVESIVVLSDDITSPKAWLIYFHGRIMGFKNALTDTVIGYIPEPNLSLIINMIFGKVTTLPESLDHSFKVTGTQHVIAASGFNVSVIGMLINFFSRRFGRFKSLLIWGVGIFIYVLSTDLSITLFRAALMAIFKRVGNDVGQKTYHNLNLLGLVFGLIIFYSPYLLFSVSFQLSVAATLGIIMFLPLVGVSDPAVESTTVMSLGNFFKESFYTTLAAQAFALPIILFHFGELSLLSLVVNTFLLWLTPIITVSGLLFLLISPAFIKLGIFENLVKIVGFYVWLPSEIFIKSLEKFGQFEGTLVTGINFSFAGLLIWWGGALIVFYLLKKRKDGKNKKIFAAYSLHPELVFLDCT